MDIVMLRKAVERSSETLAQQVEAIDRNYNRLERLLRLGVAALAGSLAIAGLVQQAGILVDAAGAAAFAVGFAGQTAGVGIGVLWSRVPAVTVGPEPAVIYQGVAEGWSETDLQISVLEELSLASRRNNAVSAALDSRARFVVRTLFAGTSMILAATAYLVGGAIYA